MMRRSCQGLPAVALLHQYLSVSLKKAHMGSGLVGVVIVMVWPFPHIPDVFVQGFRLKFSQHGFDDSSQQ